MTIHASGPFEIKLEPQPPSDKAQAANLARMSIDKQFHGDLAATSQGEMLAVRTALEDSAGYVALERVSGTLHGRRGTFVLQHSSTMNRGAPQQSITVVPDSGTEQLVGLAGEMVIRFAGEQHLYDFAYTFVK